MVQMSSQRNADSHEKSNIAGLVCVDLRRACQGTCAAIGKRGTGSGWVNVVLGVAWTMKKNGGAIVEVNDAQEVGVT